MGTLSFYLAQHLSIGIPAINDIEGEFLVSLGPFNHSAGNIILGSAVFPVQLKLKRNKAKLMAMYAMSYDAMPFLFLFCKSAAKDAKI